MKRNKKNRQYCSAGGIPCRMLFLLVAFVLFAGRSDAGHMSTDDLKAFYDFGLIPLTDDQQGVYKSGRDFVIFETMRIKRGDTVVFEPGARIFFHSHAKIAVHGTLILNGTVKSPITLGKLNVAIPKVMPKNGMVFDSTSFYIYRSASMVMHNVSIADSSISFRFTDSTSSFLLDSVRSAGNRLSLPDTTLHLWNRCLVTCAKNEGRLSQPCIPPPPKADTGIVVIREPAWKSYALYAKIACAVGAIGFAGGWYLENAKARDANDDYHASGNQHKNDGTLDEINRIGIRNRNLAAIAAGVFSAGFTLTFVFGGEHHSK